MRITPTGINLSTATIMPYDTDTNPTYNNKNVIRISIDPTLRINPTARIN